MPTPQSWVDVPAPVDVQHWLDGLVVRFRDESTARHLLHLDQRSFSVAGPVEPATESTYATFVVSRALSITVQVRSLAPERGSASQEFTFVNADIDVLDLILSMVSLATVH
jgi:hypothetical protein